jgi:hypothetical protein
MHPTGWTFTYTTITASKHSGKSYIGVCRFNERVVIHLKRELGLSIMGFSPDCFKFKEKVNQVYYQQFA